MEHMGCIHGEHEKNAGIYGCSSPGPGIAISCFSHLFHLNSLNQLLGSNGYGFVLKHIQSYPAYFNRFYPKKCLNPIQNSCRCPIGTPSYHPCYLRMFREVNHPINTIQRRSPLFDETLDVHLELHRRCSTDHQILPSLTWVIGQSCTS